MFTDAIDISSTNSWLQYKNHALELKVPKKQILDLIHFRAYVAETLIMSNMTPKKRGRPSGSPADSSACSRAGSPSTSSFSPSGVKRLREEFTSVREVRLDNVGHLAEFDEKKNATRCKNPKCRSKTHIYCVKCNVHLCIGNKKNCFRSYHLYIQGGNFNWNKVHNLEIGIFVKNTEIGQFLFFLVHILTYMVFAYIRPEVRNHPQLFFSNVRVYQVTPSLKGKFVRNTTHYLFLEYFQSLRAKK
jgi:hypothetical protein